MAQAAPNNISAELVAETSRPAPGQLLYVAFVMKPAARWHGYWKNPGDAGMETRAAWTLPAGIKAGPLLYPVPDRLLIAGLMNYVYEHDYAHPVRLEIPAGLTPGTRLPIRARLENMDLSLERAAADLYATPFQTFRRVTLPLLWPGILAGGMLAFVISLDDVVITELVKSGGQDTLPTYMLGQLRRVVTPEMNAISSVFLAISIVMVTIFFLLNRKKT